MASAREPREGKKSPTLQAGGSRTAGAASASASSSFDPLLGSAQVMYSPSEGFDSYPDYAKINTVRHNGTRQDTFRTAPALKAKEGAGPAPTRTESKANPTREMLDIFEMGVARNMANLRNEVREELQTAAKSLKADIMVALSDLRGIRLLENITEIVDAIKTGPVNVDFANVLEAVRSGTDFNRDSMNELDREATKNASSLLSEVQAMRKEHKERHETSEREQRERLDSSFAALSEASEARFATVLDEMREFSAVSERAMKEMREMQRESMRYQDRIEAASLSQHKKLGDDIGRHFEALKPRLLKITDSQETFNQLSRAIAQEVKKMQRESSEFAASLLPEMDSQITKHLQEQIVRVDFDNVFAKIRRAQTTMNQQFPNVLLELGRIQKALHVDYAQVLDTHHQESMLMLVAHDSDNNSNHSHEDGDNYRSSSRQDHSAAKLRLRTFFTQTEFEETTEGWCQTDGEHTGGTLANIAIPRPKKSKRVPIRSRVSKQDATSNPIHARKSVKAVFADSEDMKARARQALMKPQYSVFDYYQTSGHAQRIARHPNFELSSLVMIVLNAIWMAIDVDLNTAPVLLEADPFFMLGENIFCFYFTGELCIRFAAFKHKRNCLRDGWFVFDGCLVLLMVVETWIITFVLFVAGVRESVNLGDLALMRLARIVKMLRAIRMARLMRGFPELFILFKAIKAAARSVLIFVLMWLIVIYVYALIFRMISDDAQTKYFGSVPQAMNTLLLDGILPDHAGFVYGVAAENWLFWPLIMSFVGLASVLLMNMLVGVLVEVVSAIAVTEKEGICVLALATDLRLVMDMLGWNPSQPIHKEDFVKLVTEQDIAQVIVNVGVDLVSLVDMAPSVFQGDELYITFEEFVELVLNMRGTNPAKVKDVKEHLRSVKGLMVETEVSIRTSLSDEINSLKTQIRKMKADGDDDESTDDDDETRSIATTVKPAPSPSP